MKNYFNFKKIGAYYLLTNDFGRYQFLSTTQFADFMLSGSVNCPPVQNRLIQDGFTFESSLEAFIQNYYQELIPAKNYLFHSTQLHIFVVSTECNQSCIYCQAQNGISPSHGKMTSNIARKAVDIALQSPAQNLQFEFQGGEPLTNFEIIKYIVQYAENNSVGKNISYSVVTNLTLLTSEMIDFFEQYNVSISTSIDGPEKLHNINRPFCNNSGTFRKVLTSIDQLKKRDIWVGAIETTTKASLVYAEQIVQSYVDLGFDTISLRPLTPLGCAYKQWQEIGYSPEEFITFYRTAFHAILHQNQSGHRLVEGLACIFLNKILKGYGMNYMELRSPCGAGIGQIAYYYNGNIFTCDEGRMISEMGNDAFLLGTVDNDYNSLIESKVCKAVCSASVLESLPSCSVCAYQPYCGVCPAVNYALDFDIFERSPRNYRCKINSGILDTLFEYLLESDVQIIDIFKDWIL